MNIYLKNFKSYKQYWFERYRVSIESVARDFQEGFSYYEARKLIFGDLVNIQIQTVRSSIFDALENNLFQNLSGQEFKLFWEGLLMEINRDWRRKFLEHVANQRGTSENVGIIVLESFDNIHHCDERALLDMVIITSDSVIYSTDVKKTVAILDYIYIMIHKVVLNAETTASKLNGELDGLKYKDIEFRERFESHN